MDTSGTYGLQLQDSASFPSGWELLSLENIALTSISQLQNLKFFSTKSGFSAGYTLGYDEGLKTGQGNLDSTYNKGFSEGQQVGYDKGFEIGIQTGQSSVSSDALSNSVRSFVFSLFDAPVSTFTSAFNFEYDGFSIGVLVSFIFTVVVVSGVLRLVL